ncbi:MAG TPA: hypothetical protein VF041_08485 [Gemmatimonadaceae bacterium]
MNTLSAGHANAVLSRALSDFVIEFSIALHKHAMYPHGHPSLTVAEARTASRLDALLAERHSLALGVARDQLIIEGVATDPRNPLLHGLSRYLHRRDIGAVKFLEGVTRDELGAVLRSLATDPDAPQPGPEPGRGGELPSWPHVRIFPLTYGQLELIDQPESGASDADTHPWTAQLWLDLARAALQADVNADRPPTDPVLVADAINAHAREEAYDQVIVGYLLKIADELTSGEHAGSAALRERVSRLVRALEPEQLRRLLEMGSDVAQRRRFLLDASQAMAIDAVLTLVQAAADVSRQVISSSLLRLFTKLAAHAERGAAPVRAEADLGLREHIQRLVTGWELPNPSSARYAAALDHLASGDPLFIVPDESTHPCEPERIVQMSLEVGCVGPTVLEAADTMIERGGMPLLTDLLERAPVKSDAPSAIARHAITPDRLRALLEAHPLDAQLVERCVRWLGASSAEPLLDTLAAADSRATRRRVLELLRGLGPEIGPAVVARLPGAPWYYQRNLLALLDRAATWPAGFSLAPYAAHADARVRREAIRILLGVPDEREGAICSGVRDRDELVLRLALTAALDACPSAALPLVIERLERHELEADLEILAIRVVASAREPAALEFLLGCADSGRAWLGGRRLAARSPQLLAALAGLAAHWSREPRAVAVLALAARHKDPAIRSAVASWEGAS